MRAPLRYALAAVAFLIFGAAGAAGTDSIDNGNFEMGDLTGWEATGSVEVLTQGEHSFDGYSLATYGDSAVILSTGGGANALSLSAPEEGRTGSPKLSRFAPALQGGEDRDGVHGAERDAATLSTTFTITEAGALCYTLLDWLTSEGDQQPIYDDIFEVRLNGSQIQQHSARQNTFGTPSPFPDYSNPTFFSSSIVLDSPGAADNSIFRQGSSGEYRWGVQLATPGDYEVEFYVGDSGDDRLDSAIILDDVQFIPNGSCPGATALPLTTGSLTLGDTIFGDDDRDGVYEPSAGEAPIDASVDVNLFLAGNDFPVANTFGFNNYFFYNLSPNSYYVNFTSFGSLYTLTNANVGSDDASDSDVLPSGNTGVINLTTNDLTVDLGLYDSVNRPTPINFSMPQNTTLNGTVLSGTTGLSATQLSAPGSGTFNLQATGLFTYTPPTDFIGTVTFTYQVRDDFTAATSGTLTANIIVAGPPGPVTPAPTVITDYYNVNPGETITVAATEGLLANDTDALSVTVATPPAGLTVNPNGSFTYTAPGSEQDVFFSYTAVGAAANTTGFAQITVSALDLKVPGTQSTPINTPLPVSGISVTSSEPGRVSVGLQVFSGTLAVTGGNVLTYHPFEAETGKGTLFMRPLLQTANVYVIGNNSSSVQVVGPENEVNVVLNTLVYTPNANFTGIDQIFVTANDQKSLGAVAKVTIYVGLGGGGTGGTGGTGGVSGGAGTGATSLTGFFLLRDLNLQPNAIVKGEVPFNVIVNGDVFVRFIAANGTFLVPQEEIGDTGLIALGVTHSAEIFGLFFSGAAAPNFNAPVEVCIQGTGAFYYRDATGMPRTTQQLASSMKNGYTCALIPNSGTVVLIGGAPALEVQMPPQTLTDCMVTTRALMNLRADPSTSSAIVTQLPFNVTLTALERDGSWLKVDFLGTIGWANVDFLTLEGTCQ